MTSDIIIHSYTMPKERHYEKADRERGRSQ